MIGHRCKHCQWWDAEHARIAVCVPSDWMPNPGLCRKHKPAPHRLEGAVYVGIQPFMDADDLCGEFREENRE